MKDIFVGPSRKKKRVDLSSLRMIEEPLHRVSSRTRRSRKGITLARVGGLSPVRQRRNPKAPEKRGIYAFIWPNIEPFLLGSTDPEGIVKGEDEKSQSIQKRPSRFDQFVEGVEPLRKFRYEGLLWTRLNPGAKALDKRKGWHLVDAGELSKLAKRQMARQMGDALGQGHPYNYKRLYTGEHWEVFVPARRGKIFGRMPSFEESKESVATRYLNAATTPLPKSLPKEEIGLMTLEEFLDFRNPRGKWHSSDVYDSNLDKFNKDRRWTHRGLHITRGGKIDIWQHDQKKDSFKILHEGKLLAIVHKGTLYHPRTQLLPYIPQWYRDRDHEIVELNFNRTKEVKYISEVMPLVSSAAKRNLQEYPHIQQRIKVQGDYYEVRTEDQPTPNSGTTIAILNSEGQVVAQASNEWGATLLQVAREYRRKGLGKILGKYWYKWNPNFTSGGFTAKGQANAVAIWKDRVREFLSRGWYSELLRQRKISKSRIKEILKELGERVKFPEPPPKKEKEVLVFIDGWSFVIYDKAFFADPDEKYIYALGFFRDSPSVGPFIFSIDYERPFQKLATSVALQIARDNNEKIYAGKDYGDVLELKGVDVQRDGDYIYLTKDVLNLAPLKNYEKRVRRSLDQYDEKYYLLLEMAHSKWGLTG